MLRPRGYNIDDVNDVHGYSFRPQPSRGTPLRYEVEEAVKIIENQFLTVSEIEEVKRRIELKEKQTLNREQNINSN